MATSGTPHEAGALTLKVITPERIALETRVDALRIPGVDGSIGVWPRHAAMVAAIEVGQLAYTVGGSEQRMFVASGFAEVQHNVVRVVTAAGELPSEIDEARARKSEQRARERLAAGKLATGEPLDLARAELSLRRALARLSAREPRH